MYSLLSMVTWEECSLQIKELWIETIGPNFINSLLHFMEHLLVHTDSRINITY